MPTYQYRCTACSNELEVVQKFTDDALTTCPECEGSLRKIFNAVGVVFKGSGFYRTDSRSDGKSNGTKSESSSGESKSGDSKSDSSSDTKTETAKSSSSESNGSKSGSSEKKSETKKVNAGAA